MSKALVRLAQAMLDAEGLMESLCTVRKNNGERKRVLSSKRRRQEIMAPPKPKERAETVDAIALILRERQKINAKRLASQTLRISMNSNIRAEGNR